GLSYTSDLLQIITLRLGPAITRLNLRILHPDRLDVHELADSMHAQFPAMSGSLRPAKGNPRTRGHQVVDEDHSRLQFIDEAFLLDRIICPGARAQSIPVVVCDANRIIDVLHAKKGRDRA